MNRTDHMKKLRKSKTLQEIADLYNLSRERVRQIIGNTGHFLGKRKTAAINNFVEGYKEKTNEELTELVYKKFGVKHLGTSRGKSRHAIKSNSPAGVGVAAENIVSSKLSALGIDNELMPHHHTFDILLNNGIRIDVKSAAKKRIVTPYQKHSLYGFNVRKSTKFDYCDFFICYIFEEDTYYVIPNSDVGYVEFLYISHPSPKRSWSKYRKYENAFDLLR